MVYYRCRRLALSTVGFSERL